MAVPIVTDDFERPLRIAWPVLQFVDENRREALRQEQQRVARRDDGVRLTVARSIPATNHRVLHFDEVRGSFAVPIVFAKEPLPAESPCPLDAVEKVQDVAVRAANVVARIEVTRQPIQALL